MTVLWSHGKSSMEGQSVCPLSLSCKWLAGLTPRFLVLENDLGSLSGSLKGQFRKKRPCRCPFSLH